MKHTILHKRDGYYVSHPVPFLLPDGRLAVGLASAPFFDHFLVGEWKTLVSEDLGETWTWSDDPTLPPNWPGSSPREQYDRFAAIMPDGSFLCAGAVSWEEWPMTRLAEAKTESLKVRKHPASKSTGDSPSPDDEKIMVGGSRVFVQRSTDRGKTWKRREWVVPGVGHITAFPRSALLVDGTVLVTMYGPDTEGEDRLYAWRSTDQGDTWRLVPMGTYPEGVEGNESAFVEVSPGRVLVHTRPPLYRGHDIAYLMERWSDDGGLTWSHPLRTAIWGYPPHLLKLRDGRILCSFGYRREPMGVRAVLSEDGGKTWDLDHVIVLRDDTGTPSQLHHGTRNHGRSDLGYPISVQLPDGSIFTVYYITLADGITHSAATRWKV